MKQEQSGRSPHKMVWKSHPVLALLFIAALLVFCSTGLQQVIVFYIQDTLQLQAVEATQHGGTAMASMSVSMILIQFFVIKRLSLSPEKMIYIGSTLLGIAIINLLLNNSYVGILIGLSFFGMGTGFLYPAIIAKQSLVSKPLEQGAVAGANAGVQGMGVALSPIVCTTLYQVNHFFPFVLIGLVSLFIAGIYAYFRTIIVDAQ